MFKGGESSESMDGIYSLSCQNAGVSRAGGHACINSRESAAQFHAAQRHSARQV
jgi:hypothetical protein